MAYCNLDKAIYCGAGQYGVPEIAAFDKPLEINRWIGFNYARQLSYCGKLVGVHFCLDDYQFETLWNHPNKYIECFKACGAVCSPDFSLYSDFPKAIQIYNHYRKHWLAKFYQDRGVSVIPTIAWSDESSYEWCFDGEPKRSVVAVSTIGVLRNEETRKMFINGYLEMKRRLKPKRIFCFSSYGESVALSLGKNVDYVAVSSFNRKKQ